jgi:hypothetical protein
MYADETNPNQKNGILNAHRNFLRDAVYFLWENSRVAEAAKWYKILGEKYPDKIILDKYPASFPKNLTLDDYAFGRVQEDVGEISLERTTSAIEGMLGNSYLNLAIGQDDRAAGFQLKAKLIYDHYLKQIGNQPRVAPPSMNDIKRNVLGDLLDTQKPVIPYAARAAIRTRLGMPAETSAPAATSTNLPPVSTTNAVENVPTNAAAK